ncbi:MAG: hypothetical protein EP343_11255 [Deltaproteobacteria bacterium]|nr:MAG: hypothetical protein EP343_11255 [Deltaproteobacteria bacterium]
MQQHTTEVQRLRGFPLARVLWPTIGLLLVGLLYTGCPTQPNDEQALEESPYEVSLELPQEDASIPTEPRVEVPPENISTSCGPRRLCLKIEPSTARACEFVFELPSQTQVSVDFSPTVKGRSKQKSDRVAVIALARSNQAIEDGAIALQSDSDIQSLPWKISLATCYDWNGVPLSNTRISPIKEATQ